MNADFQDFKYKESIYHNALKIELERQSLTFESEKEVKILQLT